MTNLIKKIKNFSKDGNSLAKRKWLRFAGLTLLELIMVTLLAWPFLETTAAHPALPGELEQTPQMIEPAEMGPQIDPSVANNGPQAAIPTLAGTTTLTVSIETSSKAVVDSNGSTTGGVLPEVTVIAAAVTNQSATDTATNVKVVLDYNEVTNWTLVNNEIPTRTLSTLAPSTTQYVYWFARHNPANGAIGETHTYAVSVTADNADPVSTSKNSHTPNLAYTIQTQSFQSTGNQGLAQTDFGVEVGVAFTMTQVFSTGTKPDQILLGPVGNTDFNAGAYRLTKVYGRFLSSTVELGTWTDAVSVTVPIAIKDNVNSVEVTYEFVALLPATTTVCPYAAVKASGGDKFDKDFCRSGFGTRFEVNGSVSLSMTKTVNRTEVQQGEQLQYTITYTNNATQTVGSMWIWDDLPANVSIVPGTINPTNDTSESSATRLGWNITNLAPGGSSTLTFSVLVDGGGADIADGTVLLNEANLAIIRPSLAADTFRVLSSTVTSTVRAPVVSITKTDGATTAAPGDSLTYVIQITNTGPSAITGLVLTDVLPSNIILGTPSTAPTSQNGQTLVWNNNLGTIAANGGTLTVNIPYQIDPELSVDGTVLTNNAELSYQNSAGGHTFSSVTAQDVTTLVIPITTLSLNKTAKDENGPPLAEGDTILYTVLVTNTGAFTAYNVVVTDTLPSEVTCLSVIGGPGACANPIVWNVGSLSPNETQSILVRVQINLGTANNNTIINNVEVTSSNVPAPPPDDNTCPDGSTPGPNCSGDGVPIPSTTLALSKTAIADDPLAVGGNITYTLTVTNTGSETALNVTVTDDLPNEVDCVSVSPGPLPVCADPLVWQVGDLAKNGTASLMILVVVNDTGAGKLITNTVSVTATNVPTPPTVPPVCPDSSEPVGGNCPDNTIPPGGGGVYLPILNKN